jgi:hypothetical protein
MPTNFPKKSSICEVTDGNVIGLVGFGWPQLGHVFALTEQLAPQTTHCLIRGILILQERYYLTKIRNIQ